MKGGTRKGGNGRERKKVKRKEGDRKERKRVNE